MPRKSRIDAPGALHHIISRGIERREIFKDDLDRNNFINRLDKIVTDTHTGCYAWALMPNHFHLLLKTGKVPISTVMRRLLTGYAIGFNIRHRRSGHLFQNRYKSILCQEDAYLKELVRYIHLNPLRAGIVENLTALEHYRYSGHTALTDKHKLSWQDTGYVLALFSDRHADARRRYLQFVKAGIDQGHRPDLTGGGLIRSSGGWSVVKAMRKSGIWLKSDERILGDSEFVDEVLADAQEKMDSHHMLASQGITLDHLVELAARHFSLSPAAVFGGGKNRHTVKARRIVCFWAVHRLGMTMTAVAKKLGVSVPTVSLSVSKGERLVRKEDISLAKMLNIKI